MDGKYAGLWHYKEEDGAEVMTVKFVADSVVSTQCPGAPNGPCIFERPARFKGGLEGWCKYLENNLRYPDAAIDAGITGIVKVKFDIKKDGTLEEIEVVNSPHPLLSAEALRLMKKSPPWEPAILLNKTVSYRHIQSITFALQ
jgi:TonB family protein